MIEEDFALDTWVPGLLMLFLSCAIASSGGIGGGGLNLPVLLVIFKLDYSKAVVLSLSAVLGNNISQAFVNWNKRHPEEKTRQLIYWDAILVLLPAQLGGSTVGVIVAKVFPETVLLVLALFALLYAALKTSYKGRSMWRAESTKRDAVLLRSNSDTSGSGGGGGSGLGEGENASIVRNLDEPYLKSTRNSEDLEERGRVASPFHEDFLAVPAAATGDTMQLEQQQQQQQQHLLPPIEYPVLTFRVIACVWALYAIVHVVSAEAVPECSLGYFLVVLSVYPPIFVVIYWGIHHIVGKQRALYGDAEAAAKLNIASALEALPSSDFSASTSASLSTPLTSPRNGRDHSSNNNNNNNSNNHSIRPEGRGGRERGSERGSEISRLSGGREGRDNAAAEREEEERRFLLSNDQNTTADDRPGGVVRRKRSSDPSSTSSSILSSAAQPSTATHSTNNHLSSINNNNNNALSVDSGPSSSSGSGATAATGGRGDLSGGHGHSLHMKRSKKSTSALTTESEIAGGEGEGRDKFLASSSSGGNGTKLGGRTKSTGSDSENDDFSLIQNAYAYNQVNVPEGDLNFTKLGFLPAILTLFIGVLCSLLGIGGGELMGPLLLSLHVNPKMSSATTSMMSLLTSASTVLHYAILGEISPDEAGIVFVVGFMGGLTGRKLALYVVKLWRRESVLVFCLSLVLCISMCLIVFDMARNEPDFNFHNVC